MIQNTQAGNKLEGFFRGKVIQHMTHGYCKIFIPSVYANELSSKPECLPMAEQAASLFGGANNGNGEFTYPNLGSIVWCFFANGDQNYPIYFASSLGGMNAFGQYELIKHINELSSNELSDINNIVNRHMLTTGQTNVLFEENGTLVASVYSPPRTIAEVKYDESRDSKLSVDHTISRPFSNLILSNAIEHSECQFVEDVAKNNGTIQQSTNYVFPSNNDNMAGISANTIHTQDNAGTIVSQIKLAKQSSQLTANYENIANSSKDSVQLKLFSSVDDQKSGTTSNNDNYFSINNSGLHFYSQSKATGNSDIDAKADMQMNANDKVGLRFAIDDNVEKVNYLDDVSTKAGYRLVKLHNTEDDSYVQAIVDKQGKYTTIIQSIDDGVTRLDVNGSYCCLTSDNESGSTSVKITGSSVALSVNSESSATNIQIDGGKVSISADASVKFKTTIVSIESSMLDVKASSVDIKADSGIKLDAPSVEFTGKVIAGSGTSGTITGQNIANVTNGIVTSIS